MMWGIIFIGLFAAVIQYYSGYRAWLDWDREIIYKNHPGPCKLIVEDVGCEDVTHIGNGLILASCGFSWDHTKGSIKAIDLNVADEAYGVKIVNAPDRDDWLSSPHGISAWKDPKTNKHFLYVLTHPPTKDKIEVLEVLNSKELKYIKTITDPAFDLMNDLVVVGPEEFYITYFGKYRERNGVIFSDYTRLRDGKIYYYDGRKAREVATGFFRPNGINISPDKTKCLLDKVLRVKMRDNNIDVIEEIFADDGSEMMLSTAATYVKGKLVIGSFATQTMICDVKYLS